MRSAIIGCVNRVGVALMGLALMSACKSKPAPAAPITPQVTDEKPASEAWALTLPMVDGYLRYQRTLLVQAGKLEAPAWDGGLRVFEEPSVEHKANLDERARLEAGLTPDDVLKIEAMLSQVSARRLTFRMMKLDERMPAIPQPDPDDPTKGVELEQSMATHERLTKSMKDLSDEKETFGAANIEVLLKREEELLKNWALMMHVPDLANRKR